MKKTLLFLALLASLNVSADEKKLPVFSLAWSEWPGWSVFGVAHELKLLDAAEGKTGPVEQKYGIDIVLKEMDYDSCIAAFGSGQVDASCLTNMDTLPGCTGRKAVGIFPNDTSNGGDMCITVGISNISDLKGKTVYGLEKSVSQYLFSRVLEQNSIPEDSVKWVNMDPGAAALAMQQGNKDYQAIVVWNPFCIQTLSTRKEAAKLFDSSAVPGEIIDMVIAGQDALDKPSGTDFATALTDVYFQVMSRLTAPETADDTLMMIGEKFSHLNLEQMKQVKAGTAYITTPSAAYDFFTGSEIRKTMERVVSFCVSHQVVEKAPVISFGSKEEAGASDFRFDPTFLKKLLPIPDPATMTIPAENIPETVIPPSTGEVKGD